MSEPSLNTWTTIFLVVAFHGVILSGVFLARKDGRKTPNILLGLFLFLFSFNLVANVLYWSNYNLEFPHLVGIAETFHFLYGPLLLFYVLDILYPQRGWKPVDLTHLLPFALFLIWMMPFYLQTGAEKIAYLQRVQELPQEARMPTMAIVMVSLKSVLMLGYTTAIFYLIHKKKNRSDNFLFKDFPSATYQWLTLTGISFLCYIISYITYFVLIGTIDFQQEYDYVISFAMSLFIFGIGYMALLKPTHLELAHNGKTKYDSSSLSYEESEKHLEKLLKHMEQEKPYLDGDLKMADLAGQLSIPSHHLSQIINERLDKNFFEFVNAYRVEQAKRILRDPQKQDYKILRVAFESGFNTKTTFNSAFKNEVGTTPSRYREQYPEAG